MWEVPAGMADAEGTLQGQMFKEIKEETGLVVNIDTLAHHGASYTSCGLLDEEVELYSCQLDPVQFLVDTSRQQALGNRTEGELITNVEAIPLSDPRMQEDGKLRILLSHVFGA